MGGGLCSATTITNHLLLVASLLLAARSSQIKKNTQTILQSISAAKPSEGKGVKSGLGFWKKVRTSEEQSDDLAKPSIVTKTA